MTVTMVLAAGWLVVAAVTAPTASQAARHACPVNQRSSGCGIQQVLCQWSADCPAPMACCNFGCSVRCSLGCAGGCPEGHECHLTEGVGSCRPRPVNCYQTGCEAQHSCQTGPKGPVCRHVSLPSCANTRCPRLQICRLVAVSGSCDGKSSPCVPKLKPLCFHPPQ
ncbi:keratin-associated protein 5-4-like [Pollicipes pollicipes]|uniref:keratin-associated protein 5-4-like n=1 Tax=Pollicipes pollicipes TaxID=41117 RepID=UPI001884D947|nr:keratin-associated protein 5-4-like [Pollicipes pollicipes]